MSLELGVVAAGLTGRSLVLKGNQTPIANIVQYGGAVSNRYPSRVTDLVDPGIPWADAETMNLSAFSMHEICPQPAWETVFCMPAHLSMDSDDFKAFAGRRKSFVTVTDEIQRAPALSLSGGPEALTLSFYSTFFYLDRSAQQRAIDTLRNMKPRKELSEFARHVASDLGSFNAVHIRRGDFKKTLGVTTLDRTPREAIEALDHHFSRDDCLVILTDEAEDPFFNELRDAYKQIVFLDHHILEHHGAAFLDLPTHDSIALAYLSQLVAAHSDDFHRHDDQHVHINDPAHAWQCGQTRAIQVSMERAATRGRRHRTRPSRIRRRRAARQGRHDRAARGPVFMEPFQ